MMTELNGNIKKLHNIFKEIKNEFYKISNPETTGLDEYIKKLYFEMLCTIIQYENNASKMQILYLRRLFSGIQLEGDVEDYIRKALEITETDVREFVDCLRSSKARYYFTLEGIILVALGIDGQEAYEYFAELIEIIGIKKAELEHLSKVARSVLAQKSSYYDEAKTIATTETKKLNFVPYIIDYYQGAMVDTVEDFYYLSPDNEKVSEIQLPTEYSQKNITFKNLHVVLQEDWRFVNCGSV